MYVSASVINSLADTLGALISYYVPCIKVKCTPSVTHARSKYNRRLSVKRQTVELDLFGSSRHGKQTAPGRPRLSLGWGGVGQTRGARQTESPFPALHPRVLRQFYQLFRAIPSRTILPATRADGGTARFFLRRLFFLRRHRGRAEGRGIDRYLSIPSERLVMRERNV